MAKTKGGLGKGLGSLFGDVEVAPDGTVLGSPKSRALALLK